VTVAVTAFTRNVNLVPTVILLGSFLVPFVVVLFAAERIRGLHPTALLLVFFLSGVFGVLGASLLESGLEPSLALYLLIGLIEEAVKAVILVVAAWRLAPKTAGQGALLGAVVGAGFAAFESAGYAFQASLSERGIDLGNLLQTEVIRAVLTPAGHVLWTAVVGAAVLNSARRTGRMRLTLGVVAAFVAVVVLHALWDAAGGLSALLALVLTGNVARVERFGTLPAAVADEVVALSLALYVTALVVVTLLGALSLWLAVRRRPAAEAAPVESPSGERADQ
jgi:RsiW-degrading membrane proteinase PrsW (M82 family)